ncbi:MAG: hypothetical protein AB7F28_00225 [Candidatus Margulisiibacteriota bacterium]
MIPKWIFPLMLIALDICAACVYAFDGDLRKTVYWFSAAALTTAVTF